VVNKYTWAGFVLTVLGIALMFITTTFIPAACFGTVAVVGMGVVFWEVTS